MGLTTRLRYLLPIAILFILSLSKWTLQPRFIPPPITELNLQTTITDLSTIQALVPTTSAFALPPLPVPVLLRVAATIYVPYLLLTYVVPLRVILGVTGTLLLSWHAPWAVVLRTTLWRSAWVRWGLYHTWSCISGQPLPVVSHALQVASTPPEPVNSLRFLFQIYENQRWWMGLDWTAALLPGERPSWCSAPPSLHPVSPPNAFSLPEESTVFLADGKGGREKRTATWRWEEAEWKVAVRLQGTPLTRVEKPLPSLKEENPSLLAKAAAKTREAAGGSGGPGGGGDGNGDKHGEDDDEAEEEEDVTDGDGWIYGDNKWEGKSDKGSGLGKVSRFPHSAYIISELRPVHALPTMDSRCCRQRGRRTRRGWRARRTARSNQHTTKPNVHYASGLLQTGLWQRG